MTARPDISRGDQPPRAPRRFAIFAIIALALLMSSLDQTIVATVLHAMQHGLHTSINWASWTITAYSLGLIMMLPVAGKLSDRYGRRRLFVASVTVFTAASLCCGLTNNVYLLIVLRAVQAAGGAGFTPSATGIVVDHFGRGRDKAVGLFGSIFPIGAMTGPIFGGLLVSYWSWRGIFLVNVPIGLLLLLLCLEFVPRDPPRGAVERQKMDLSGMVLLGVGVLAGMVSITYLGQSEARLWSPLFLGPALVAVVALWRFVRHIGHATSPFISPRLIHGRGFAAVNIINILYGGAVTGLMALVPLYATNRYRIDALHSGTLLTAQGVAVIVLASLAAIMLRRTGYRLPLFLGSAIIALGMLGLALRPPWASPYLWLVATTCLVGIGIGWSSPASRNAGLQLAPEQSAPLAGLRTTGRQVGQITVISITTAILAQTPTPGVVQAFVFAVFALMLILGLPVIARVPEHRGAW